MFLSYSLVILYHDLGANVKGLFNLFLLGLIRDPEVKDFIFPNFSVKVFLTHIFKDFLYIVVQFFLCPLGENTSNKFFFSHNHFSFRLKQERVNPHPLLILYHALGAKVKGLFNFFSFYFILFVLDRYLIKHKM